ncbi:MAG: hypothetical protein ETSY1_23545 [Candidatus Entotheonella factor]|uniref:Uncharacterized protein n=1 Tax=Entotheonella factor TaxID=1429438 RepID=W4LGI9_ENTF1|nr:MAG: hypothetical protein ETSY1_23545 [Candidatus Entotheonella factor]
MVLDFVLPAPIEQISLAINKGSRQIGANRLLNPNHPLMTDGIACGSNVNLNILVEPIQENKQPLNAETIKISIFQVIAP